MGFDYSFLITFVLTAFSTITTVLPFLIPSPDSQSPDIYRFQALEEPSHKTLAQKLSADNILHDLTNVSNQGNQNNQRDPNVTLALAAMNYNINNTEKTQEFDHRAGVQNLCTHKSDCLQKVWYISRVINLDSQNKNIIPEDTKCDGTPLAPRCTQNELVWIDGNVSQFASQGYAFQFYNDKDPVNLLQKSMDIFIADLHTFIIISIITGPIIFIIAVRTYPESKRKNKDKKVKSK